MSLIDLLCGITPLDFFKFKSPGNAKNSPFLRISTFILQTPLPQNNESVGAADSFFYRGGVTSF